MRRAVPGGDRARRRRGRRARADRGRQRAVRTGRGGHPRDPGAAGRQRRRRHPLGHARSSGDEPVPELRAAPDPRPGRSAFEVRPGVTPVDRYLAAVAAARDAVRDGSLLKAVIAREISVRSDEPIDVHAVLLPAAGLVRVELPVLDRRVRRRVARAARRGRRRRRCGRIRWPAPRRARAIRPPTTALAAELHASTKNQIEHRVVIDMVHDTLLPWCSYLDWEPEPSIVTVANVQHLGTRDGGPAVRPAAQRARARPGAVAHAGARRLSPATRRSS